MTNTSKSTEESRRSAEAQKTMGRIGLQLIAEKKASIIAASGESGVETKNVIGRDLLTLLIKANMATDIPESQRLSDEEMLARKVFQMSVTYFANKKNQRSLRKPLPPERCPTYAQ